jgi:hypothetical protein
MSSFISSPSFYPAYNYYNYPPVHLEESAQEAVTTETSAPMHGNFVETKALQERDPLVDFDGFQLQDPNKNEEFSSTQQKSLVIRNVNPHMILQSFSLSQHIKANWEKFKLEHKINFG